MSGLNVRAGHARIKESLLPDLERSFCVLLHVRSLHQYQSGLLFHAEPRRRLDRMPTRDDPFGSHSMMLWLGSLVQDSTAQQY